MSLFFSVFHFGMGGGSCHRVHVKSSVQVKKRLIYAFAVWISQDAVVWLSQSIKEEKRETGALWDTYNSSARPNSVCI